MNKQIPPLSKLNDDTKISAKIIYKITEDKNDFIIQDFDSNAEEIESIQASDVIKKKVTEAFPGIVDFGLFDILHQVYKTGVSTIHPISLYKDDIKLGWRRNIVVKTDEDELTVWYQDYESDYDNYQSLEMFKQILMFSSDAIAITDANAHITYVNDNFIQSTGYTQNELINQKMSILKSGEHDQLYYQNMWTQLTHYEVWEDDMINRHKDGSHYIDNTIIIPIYSENSIITNYITIKKDITNVKLKEQVFRTYIRKAQMGEMMSIIAHQWKQPLSVLSSLNSSLEVRATLNEGLNKNTIKTNCNKVEQAIQSMTSTMDDFRNFYSPKQNKKNSNLLSLIDESILLIQGTLLNHNIDIEKNIDTSITVKIYKNEIKQVFLNLLKNFIDIVDENKIPNPKIIITAIENEHSVIIKFQDNGGGIPPALLEKVFGSYFTTKDEDKGTGLGLYMSKLVIEEHCRGTISVENYKDGALFTIKLSKL